MQVVNDDIDINRKYRYRSVDHRGANIDRYKYRSIDVNDFNSRGARRIPYVRRPANRGYATNARLGLRISQCKVKGMDWWKTACLLCPFPHPPCTMARGWVQGGLQISIDVNDFNSRGARRIPYVRRPANRGYATNARLGLRISQCKVKGMDWWKTACLLCPFPHPPCTMATSVCSHEVVATAMGLGGWEKQEMVSAGEPRCLGGECNPHQTP